MVEPNVEPTKADPARTHERVKLSSIALTDEERRLLVASIDRQLREIERRQTGDAPVTTWRSVT